ncbi:adenylate kinase family protein [Actinomadura napierensis]|uniref:Adenylate kinase n=1 Tax=Actinomadura napierensis TaxID=267854 RepID=A0ABN3AAC0_9ACTN
MRKYVILGPQGSGKGTQSLLLARDLDLVHIGVGDIFRWHVQNHTKLGAQVRRAMAAGDLVGDDLVEGVVRERLDQHDWNYGFIIDGFPRSRRQAEFFLESYDIDGVIHLDMPDSEVRRRVLARRLCSQCGMDYNLIADRPTEEGRCDVCGGELVAREDDTEEAVAERLRLYREKTAPILELFGRKEYVVTVDARPGIEAVQRTLRDELGLPAPK